MSEDVLMFKDIHANIRNTYNRLGKNTVAATNLPRGNFSDVCQVLSNMMIIDILEDIDVELKVSGVDLFLIFSVKGEDK